MHRGAIGVVIALLAGCADLPRDPDGTLERVRRAHRFTVGQVADTPAAAGVLRRIAQATGAAPAVRTGQLEPLLLQLEEGSLDLVIGGRFDAKTPWATRVSLGEPLTVIEDGKQHDYVVARNGENAWITLVGRAVKAERGR